MPDPELRFGAVTWAGPGGSVKDLLRGDADACLVGGDYAAALLRYLAASKARVTVARKLTGL